VLEKFASIGVDLIAGLPGQTTTSFSRSLRSMLGYQVIQHLSVYDLAVAADTPFGRHQRILRLGERETNLYDKLQEITGVYGFKQYEISNYARKGYECRHNKGYWNHIPYLGLGCSAHSYLHPYRFANISNVKRYCSDLRKGTIPLMEKEVIDNDTLAREMAFLGFRQVRGLNEETFLQKTGYEFTTWAGKETLDHFLREMYMEYHKPWWVPTKRGICNADFIARSLF
jgi:oxygen-independent coproporphyrinogen-3 oxidase